MEDPANLPPPPPTLLNNSSQHKNPPASLYSPPDVVRNITPSSCGGEPHCGKGTDVAPSSKDTSPSHRGSKVNNKDSRNDVNIDKLKKDQLKESPNAEDPQELCKAIDDIFFQDMVIKHKTLV